MSESVTQPPDTNSTEGSDQISIQAQEAVVASPTPTIIWTPVFIVVFSLTLVLGLSAESLLTQGWLNSAFPGYIVFLTHIAFICLCWIVTITLTRSWWIRLGAIFGSIWTVFMSTNIVLNIHRLDPNLPILAHLNAAICIALLGSSLCLSLAYTPFRPWDTWFFSLALVGGSCTVILAYLLTPATHRSLTTLEISIAVVALALAILAWWFRSSCWQSHPGLTLLLGTTPLLLLCIAIPSYTAHEPDFLLSQLSSLPIHDYFLTNETRFFLLQVALLSLLLGAMRILQGEIRSRSTPGANS